MSEIQEEYSGNLLAEKRKNMLLTQEELAELIGVHKLTVSNWETGRKKPTIRNIRLLQRALKPKRSK